MRQMGKCKEEKTYRSYMPAGYSHKKDKVCSHESRMSTSRDRGILMRAKDVEQAKKPQIIAFKLDGRNEMGSKNNTIM